MGKDSKGVLAIGFLDVVGMRGELIMGYVVRWRVNG